MKFTKIMFVSLMIGIGIGAAARAERACSSVPDFKSCWESKAQKDPTKIDDIINGCAASLGCSYTVTPTPKGEKA